MRLDNTVTTLLLAAGAQAVLKSRAVSLPAHVHAIHRPGAEEVVTLQIGLKLRSIDRLEGMLRAVSDPASATYGSYLSQEEVSRTFAPSEASRAAVLAWLESFNVTGRADFGPFINMATTVGVAQEMLQATFQYFLVGGARKLRTREYHVPDHLAEHVDLISPTTFFGAPRGVRARAPALDVPVLPPDCGLVLTPQCLGDMYKYGGYTVAAPSPSRVGFGSFLNESALQDDVTLYRRAYGLAETSLTKVLVNGGEDHGVPGAEANMDAQILAAVAPNLSVTEFITGGRPPFIPNLDVPDEEHNTNEPYLEYYHYLMNVSDADMPQVITNSYSDDEQTVPLEYATRVCNLIGMLGLRGVTVIEASGDTGVGAPCQSNDGLATPQFTPQFPASCPYVTAVGGTQSAAPAVAWPESSGGFSDYFAQPWYQAGAVAAYLGGIGPGARAYHARFANFSGRAFPDLAAHSFWPPYATVVGGLPSVGGGTSAAAPVVAGVVALLNDARLRGGKPPLGFLNPWLYAGAGAGALADVTGGGARGCTGVNGQTGQAVPNASVIPWAAWNATAGWDPVTGWGVPDFGAMLAALP